MTQEQVRSNHPQKSDNGATGPASPAEALLEKMANEAVEIKPVKGGFGKTIRDIVIVSALLAGGTYFYYSNVTTKEAVNKLIVEAQQALEKDDMPSLDRAAAKYEEALALDGDNADALAGMAEVNFYKWRHGADTKAQAADFLRRAEAEDAEKPGVMAVKAYLQIVDGQSSQVVANISGLLEKGIYHPKLAHAYGWALMEQGKYEEAARSVRQAIDTRFSAVRFSNTMAEINHRKGDESQAIRQLSKSLSSGMNPDHDEALAWSAALRAKNYGNLKTPALAIQKLSEKKDKLGSVAQGYLAWAETELSLAFGNPKGAVEKADEAIKLLPEFAPVYDAKGRSLYAAGKKKDGLAEIEKAMSMKPAYLGIKWTLAEYKSKAKDDSALALVDELEAQVPAKDRGPEFELFRGEHYLRKGELDKAKEHFTKAADLGDDARILLGLANVTFAEEQKKGKKADLEAVGEKFTEVYNRKSDLPELHESLAAIELWNFNAGAADKSFQEAEANYKKRRRPVPELLEFYDRVIRTFRKADGPKGLKKEAAQLSSDWKTRKEDYLKSVGALTN